MTQKPWHLDGRLHFGVGIEDTFVPQEAPAQRGIDEYELTQHYRHWREDLDLAAESGAELIRWGIPWYLVEPRPGEFDWSWLDEVAEHLRATGLRCIVDLMHYGTPLWLDNQFLGADYPERVASYARAVAERYRDVWTDFTPLNEPIINAIYCGETGEWPPYLHGQDGFVKIILQLARGMVRTQQEIAAVQPEARFVHVDAGFRWAGDAAGAVSGEILRERRFLAADLIMGRVGAGHPLRGWLTGHGATDAQLDWFIDNAVRPDVMGVNYYPAFTTVRFEDDGSTSPVEAGTEGLADIVGLYRDRYGIPLAVTETSRGGSVESRVIWLDESTRAIDEMRAAGTPVVAYFWFPFFTLVDWLWRHDLEPADRWFVHMGLVDLRRGADRDLSRVRTEAFARFQRIAGGR